MLARLERDGATLRAAFTAVADLRRAAIAGYEVTLGFPGEATLPPRAWAHAADPADAAQIEARALRVAISQRALFPPGPVLYVTLSPRALGDRAVLDVLASFGRLDDVVLVTDIPSRGEEFTALEQALGDARAAGASLCVEASGAGYETLQAIARLGAEYVRIESTLVEGIADDAAKQVAVEGLVRLGGQTGAIVMGDGAVHERDLAELMRLGVTQAIGPLFGMPEEEPAPLRPGGITAIRTGAREQLRHTDVTGLIEAVPALPSDAALDALADAFLADPRHDFLVLLDEDFRPVALVERAALLHAEPYEHLVTTVTASTPVGVAARRAVARPTAERFLPLVCVDVQGRYAGLVRVDGLLEALAMRS